MKKSTTKSEFVSASQTYRAVWLKTRYDYDYVPICFRRGSYSDVILVDLGPYS